MPRKLPIRIPNGEATITDGRGRVWRKPAGKATFKCAPSSGILLEMLPYELEAFFGVSSWSYPEEEAA